MKPEISLHFTPLHFTQVVMLAAQSATSWARSTATVMISSAAEHRSKREEGQTARRAGMGRGAPWKQDDLARETDVVADGKGWGGISRFKWPLGSAGNQKCSKQG